MHERRLMKQICKLNANGQVGKDRPRRTCNDQIEELKRPRQMYT